jgi:hypothetical protein
LTTLRTAYNTNPRPDSYVKEELSIMTNLSTRVIRVWFQNKRCKDKKLLKEEETSETEKASAQFTPLQAIGPLQTPPAIQHQMFHAAPPSQQHQVMVNEQVCSVPNGQHIWSWIPYTSGISNQQLAQPPNNVSGMVHAQMPQPYMGLPLRPKNPAFQSMSHPPTCSPLRVNSANGVGDQNGQRRPDLPSVAPLASI